MWAQYEFRLAAKQRGFHLVTTEVLSQLSMLKSLEIGSLNLFIKHTSASLAINENADPSVRADLESHFNHFAPERAAYYQHTDEGDDDMPAHIKSCILGCSLNIPISKGALNIGVWQGIYLCEHRNHATDRQLVATLQGQEYPV